MFLRNAILSLSIFLLVKCQVDKASDKSLIRKTYSTESAELFLSIAEKMQNDQPVNDSDWSALFRSKGYKPFLNNADSISMQHRIKNALITVFDKTQKDKLDSIRAQPIEMNRYLRTLMTVKNFYELKQNLPNAKSFLSQTNFVRIIEKADSTTRKFLPNAPDSATLYDVHIFCSEPDAKVKNQAIILDLNNVLQMGTNEMVKLIAHEFHHNYRELARKPSQNLTMQLVDALHSEGLADMIDKQKPPLEELGLLPESVVSFYNAYYKNTPSILQKFDSLVAGYSDGTIEQAVFENEVNGYFKFGGHPTGYYMVLLIYDELGSKRLIETFDQPVEFIKLYNQVAASSSGEHVFSDKFIEYISQIGN